MDNLDCQDGSKGFDQARRACQEKNQSSVDETCLGVLDGFPRRDREIHHRAEREQEDAAHACHADLVVCVCTEASCENAAELMR